MGNSENVNNLIRRLDRLQKQLERPLEANREVSVEYYKFVIRNFELEGRLVQGGWAPLKPATIKYKRRHGYSKKLVNTGQLKGSYVPFYDEKTAGVRTDLDYAADHQFGVPSRNLPARPMVPSTKQAAEIAIKIYDKFVKKQIARF